MTSNTPATAASATTEPLTPQQAYEKQLEQLTFRVGCMDELKKMIFFAAKKGYPYSKYVKIARDGHVAFQELHDAATSKKMLPAVTVERDLYVPKADDPFWESEKAAKA